VQGAISPSQVTAVEIRDVVIQSSGQILLFEEPRWMTGVGSSSDGNCRGDRHAHILGRYN
jgi:hypothetical protein